MDRLRRLAAGMPAWQWLLLGLAVCSFFIYLWTPMYSDDLFYKAYFSGASPRYGSWLSFPRHVVSHYFYANGRLVDKFVPLAVNLPGWLLAGLSAAGLWGMYCFCILASGVRRGWVPFALVGALALVLPWWDYLCLFAMQMNYVWVTALVMGAYCAVVRVAGSGLEGARKWGLEGLCFVAGMSHEGAAVPMLCGWALYFLLSGRRPDRAQRWLLGAFVAGAAITILSPGMWGRVAPGGRVADSTPLLLVLRTEPAVVALWLSLAVALLFKRGRAVVSDALRGPAGVLVYATLAGAPIILVSGIGGRAGWFVSVYALVAGAGVFGRLFTRPMRGLQWGLGALLIAQGAGTAWIQHGLYREYREFEAAYLASEDGVVKGAFTQDDELPGWTLGRLRGVPDADDTYIRCGLRDYLRTDSVAPTVVLPTTRIVDGLPDGVREINDGGLRIWVSDDGMVYQPYGEGYTEDRRIIDSGD